MLARRPDEPSLAFLLDEPSLGLAPIYVEGDGHGAGSGPRGDGALVEQMLALAIADRAYVMETGQIALSGSAADLKNDPRIRSAYLGG